MRATTIVCSILLLASPALTLPLPSSLSSILTSHLSKRQDHMFGIYKGPDGKAVKNPAVENVSIDTDPLAPVNKDKRQNPNHMFGIYKGPPKGDNSEGIDNDSLTIDSDPLTPVNKDKRTPDKMFDVWKNPGDKSTDDGITADSPVIEIDSGGNHITGSTT